MKTKLLLISLLILGSTFGAYAQSELFATLANEKNVTVVTITKTLLNMMPKESAAKIDMNGVQISDLISKLDQIDVFTSEDSAVMKIMRDGVKSSIQSNKAYENIMKVKDEGSEVGFYIERGEADLIKSLIMFVDEAGECVLIRMLGSFTIEDIQKISNQ